MHQAEEAQKMKQPNSKESSIEKMCEWHRNNTKREMIHAANRRTIKFKQMTTTTISPMHKALTREPEHKVTASGNVKPVICYSLSILP